MKQFIKDNLTGTEIEIDTIEESAPFIPEIVPFEITARQMRMSLIMSGVDLQNITDALEQLPEPQKSLAKVEWEYAGTFERQNEMLKGMAVQLGFSDEQLDRIFIEGSKI